MFELLNTIPFIGGSLSTILAFIVVISIVVFVHEFGHYIVGRWCGIGAETFSLGFGPVLWSRMDKRGTKWQVALIPMGGFVKFLGDQDAASTQGRATLDSLTAEEAAKRFHTASLGRRAMTVFAGPAANFLLSIVVFAMLLFVNGRVVDAPIVGDYIGKDSGAYTLQVGDEITAVEGQAVTSLRDVYEYTLENDATATLNYTVLRDGIETSVVGPFPMPAYVRGVEPLSPAAKAGLQEGDTITAINDTDVFSFEQLRQVVMAAPETELPITVMRDGQPVTLAITPKLSDRETEDGGFEKRVAIGVYGGLSIEPMRVTPTPWYALWDGVERTWGVITGSVRGLYHMIAGNVGIENLQGPLGIAQVSGATAQTGLVNLVGLIAVISTAIGFINLFPIPVLDGGHLVMFAYEAVAGRPLNERIMRFATVLGLSLLLTMMIFATFNDIMRL